MFGSINFHFAGSMYLDWILLVFIFLHTAPLCSNVKTEQNIVLKVCADQLMTFHDLLHAPSRQAAPVVPRNSHATMARYFAAHGAAWRLFDALQFKLDQSGSLYCCYAQCACAVVFECPGCLSWNSTTQRTLFLRIYFPVPIFGPPFSKMAAI
jgi:hypothetical protein